MKARLFSPENRKWWTLVAVAVGLFMIMLVHQVVDRAVAVVQQGPRVGPSGVGWVFNALRPHFRGVLLQRGKLGGLPGARRVFLRRLVIFTAASLWCGLA